MGEQVARTADFAVRVFSVAINATVPSSIVRQPTGRNSGVLFFPIDISLPSCACSGGERNSPRLISPCGRETSTGRGHCTLFCLTAWVFLPDHWQRICAPVYPVTISLAMKSVKQGSMRAVNHRRGAEGELWQPGFFDRALRTIKEYN